MNTTTYGLKSWRYTAAKIWNALPDQFRAANNMSKGPGKRGHIVADTLLPMMFLGLRKLGNICCGHKMFLNKIRNTFCVPDTKFVSATNVAPARGQTGKHLCRQQCVRNNVSSFLISQILYFNCALKYILLSCDPLLV